LRLRKKGLASKLNAKDAKEKTALDWAIERRILAMLNPQNSESKLKIIVGCKEVSELLISKNTRCNETNKLIYNEIVQLDANIEKHVSQLPRSSQKITHEKLLQGVPDKLLPKLTQWAPKRNQPNP
jgi:hypothetical protein